jgi:hypothetical protein
MSTMYCSFVAKLLNNLPDQIVQTFSSNKILQDQYVILII